MSDCSNCKECKAEAGRYEKNAKAYLKTRSQREDRYSYGRKVLMKSGKEGTIVGYPDLNPWSGTCLQVKIGAGLYWITTEDIEALGVEPELDYSEDSEFLSRGVLSKEVDDDE